AQGSDRGADDAPFLPEESSPGPRGAGLVPAPGHAPRPPAEPEARRDQAGGRSGCGADVGGGPQVLPPGRPRQDRGRPLTFMLMEIRPLGGGTTNPPAQSATPPPSSSSGSP